MATDFGSRELLVLFGARVEKCQTADIVEEQQLIVAGAQEGRMVAPGFGPAPRDLARFHFDTVGRGFGRAAKSYRVIR